MSDLETLSAFAGCNLTLEKTIANIHYGVYFLYMYNFGTSFGMGMPGWGPAFGLGLIILVAWSILWKGLALWRAAHRGEKVWFIVFLLINTAGILEIIYLFFITGAKLSDFQLPGTDKTKQNS